MLRVFPFTKFCPSQNEVPTPPWVCVFDYVKLEASHICAFLLICRGYTKGYHECDEDERAHSLPVEESLTGLLVKSLIWVFELVYLNLFFFMDLEFVWGYMDGKGNANDSTSSRGKVSFPFTNPSKNWRSK